MEKRTRGEGRILCRAAVLSLGLLAGAGLLSGCATGTVPFFGLGEKEMSQKFAGFEYCEVPVVKQGSQRSCGMAALVSLLQYWKEDRSISESVLRKKYPPDSDNGYPLAQLKEVAVQEGLLAFAVTLDLDPMAQLMAHLAKGRPVLVAAKVPKGRYFGDGLPLVETLDRRVLSGLGDPMKHHYIVAMGMSDREILLMDPQYGHVRTARKQFEQFWKEMGYAALVTSKMPQGVEVAAR